MIHLQIVTPERSVFSDTVSNVYLPTLNGEIGVLDLHAALVTALTPGELRYEKDGVIHELAIGVGFAEATQTSVTVLSDLAQNAESADEAKVEEAIKRAEEDLSKLDLASQGEEVARLQAIIAKNSAVLRLIRKKRI